MKVLFSGGGTLGSVTPLLAIYEAVKEAYPECEFVWVGTNSGPERELVEKEGIRFISITSGKLRRYFSLLNFVDIAKIKIAMIQSFFLLNKERPDMCISAGAYVSLPIHFVARLKRIPTWVHQLDIKPGLCNKIMSKWARLVTTSVEESGKSFPKYKVRELGALVRKDILDGSKERARENFKLKSDLSVVFVLGGGTGARRVNELIVEALPNLEGACQVVHLSGRDRDQSKLEEAKNKFGNYQFHKFLTKEIKDLYAVADVVVARGGFGTLSELAALNKPTILIPKAGHQEDNVKFFVDKNALLALDEETTTGELLAEKIKETLKQNNLGERLSTALPMARGEDIMKSFELVLHE